MKEVVGFHVELSQEKTLEPPLQKGVGYVFTPAS